MYAGNLTEAVDDLVLTEEIDKATRLQSKQTATQALHLLHKPWPSSYDGLMQAPTAQMSRFLGNTRLVNSCVAGIRWMEIDAGLPDHSLTRLECVQQGKSFRIKPHVAGDDQQDIHVCIEGTCYYFIGSKWNTRVGSHATLGIVRDDTLMLIETSLVKKGTGRPLYMAFENSIAGWIAQSRGRRVQVEHVQDLYHYVEVQGQSGTCTLWVSFILALSVLNPEVEPKQLLMVLKRCSVRDRFRCLFIFLFWLYMEERLDPLNVPKGENYLFDDNRNILSYIYRKDQAQ